MELNKARLAKLLVIFLLINTGHLNKVFAWDPQPTNPFPGVPFGGEIPGYTKTVPCQPSDCGIGIVPVIDCPAWSAADGGGGFDVGYAKRFCRNSWTPPTSAADDEDFRNRQQLAIAQATAESQAWNAAHPGEQKCITWGPVVHANGISTASGGVCANPVGTKSDGTTSQAAPSKVGTIDPQTGQTTNNSSTGSSSNNGSSTTQQPAEDYSMYGLGKPFTRIVKGDSSKCPSGFTAASNQLSGTELTECWPENAWAAYSVGGQIWSDFKNSNGSKTAQIAAEQQVQINATRMLALQKAQTAANLTPGIKRCFNWEAFGQSGQECAFIPAQSSTSSNIGTNGTKTDTSTAISTSSPKIEFSEKTSNAGISIAEWKNSATYQSLICPTGYEKSTSLNMNGTISTSDDTWTSKCVMSLILQSTDSKTATSDSSTVSTKSDTSTASSSTDSNRTISSNESPNTFKPELDIVSVQLQGSSRELSNLAAKIEESKSQVQQIQSVLTKVEQVSSKSYSSTIKLPVSRTLEEKGISSTPAVCTIKDNVISRVSKGICIINYVLQSEAGNSYTVAKQIQFK